MMLLEKKGRKKMKKNKPLYVTEKQRIHKHIISIIGVNRFINLLIDYSTKTKHKMGPQFAYYELIKHCRQRVNLNKKILVQCFDELKNINNKNQNFTYKTGEMYNHNEL
jgi:ABC-type dipeptide/oligopeptide/nickel transport system permease component